MMKLEEQICSLELAKKLKELGVKQESLCYWHEQWRQGSGVNWELILQGEIISENNLKRFDINKKRKEYFISAFTVAELGEMLPKATTTYMTDTKTRCKYNHHEVCVDELSEANARAKCLIYLLENGYLNEKTLS